jgi:hypothetical protein
LKPLKMLKPRDKIEVPWPIFRRNSNEVPE